MLSVSLCTHYPAREVASKFKTIRLRRISCIMPRRRTISVHGAQESDLTCIPAQVRKHWAHGHMGAWVHGRMGVGYISPCEGCLRLPATCVASNTSQHGRMQSSGMLRRVALVRTDISEEPSASFIMVTRISELGTTLAVTSNGRTLRSISIFRMSYEER
jgi:hypothetical protein